MAASRVLRASMAWRLLPLAIAAETFAIFSRGTLWLGEWNWTTDWVNGATILTMPLVAACAAFDASAMLRPEARALVTTTPRGLLGFTWPMWSTFLVFAPVHLLGLACGFALNIRVGAGDTPSATPLLVAFTALAAAAAIGQGVGVVLPSVLAAPVAGVALLAVNIVGTGDVIPQFMRIGGATGTLVGQTWDLRVLLLDHAVHLGLVLGLTLGVALVCWPRTTRWPRHVLAGACAAVVAVSLLALHWQPSLRLTPSTRHLDFVCHHGEAEVCLAAATSRKLPSLSKALDEQLAYLRAASVTTPSRFQQVVPGQASVTQGTAPLYIESLVLNSPRTSALEAATYVTLPAQCPELTGDEPPPSAYFEVRPLLRLWLLVSQGEVSPTSVADVAIRRWLLLPVADQHEWVRMTYARLASCDLDALRLPLGG